MDGELGEDGPDIMFLCLVMESFIEVTALDLVT